MSSCAQAAALHAAIIEPGCTGGLAQLSNTASYEHITMPVHYAQDAEWSFIFNVMSHYDLPDLAAALASAGVPQLVAGATDSLGAALPQTNVSAAFEFAAETARQAKATLRLVGGTGAPDKALLDFLRGL